MRYRMPYVFKANVKPRGKRNSVSLDFGGYIDLELAETSADDAPTVVDWTYRSRHGGESQRMTGRVRAGRFYAAVKNDEGDFLRAADLEPKDIYSFTHVGPYSEPKPIDLFVEGKLKHSVRDYREVEYSTEEDVIEQVRKAAAEFLIVDGLVYLPHPVPVITTSVDSYRDSSVLKLGISYEVDPARGSDVFHFRINEVEAATAWANEAAESLGGQGRIVNNVEAVVYRPDLLPDPDFFIMDLHKTIGLTLEASSKTLHVMPDHFIDAWQDLRRTRNALFEGCAEGVADAAMSAWASYLESHDAVEEEKHNSWGREYDPNQDTEWKLYRYFLPRWDGHAIKLEMGQGFSPLKAN